VTRDDALVEEFRLAGRLMALGLRTAPPRLPHTPHAMQAVKREAARDPRIRRALEASIAKDEKARQLRPQVLRRDCGEILDVR
jgi:hypothetical protein